ncbi:hypothetical protein ACFY2W_03995 [Streptomyces sp. NPDC001262]|uniref:hypothetical protein n=1 Tax=Streptomyces sp. NPDC001262 TaxID=3364552 RepID=UPI0036BF7017
MVPALPSWNAQPLYLVAAAVPAAWAVWRCLRKLCGAAKLETPAVRVAALAAVACTAYSGDTDWGFAADYLHMNRVAERATLFGAAELALFSVALMARQNLNGSSGAPGAPGLLVWVIAGVQVIPAYAESGPVGGTVRAFFGPIMAAMLWHLAMGIELRHKKPDAESHSLAAVVGREARERLLSRLGIAQRTRDAAQITRDRATVRAVALAARLAEMTPKERGERSGRRTARRLSAAVARASVGTNSKQRQQLLEQLAARRHAVGLATVDLPSPWSPGQDPAASALAGQTRHQMREATERIRQRGYPRVLFADVAPAQGVNAEERSPEHEPSDAPPAERAEQDAGAKKLDTAEAQAAIEEGWAEGLSVRETAKRATRAPSYVHGVFVKLDSERGPRPAPGQLALLNGFDKGEPS